MLQVALQYLMLSQWGFLKNPIFKNYISIEVFYFFFQILRNYIQ